jgi:hypothetical protein
MPRRTDISSIRIIGAGPIAPFRPMPMNPSSNQAEASYVQAL